jgi:hypothetical protein
MVAVSAPGSTSPSRVLGILAVVSGALGAAISFLGWGVLLPVLAIVLALVARRREPASRVLWVVGLLLGIVGLVVSVISLYFQVLALTAFASLDF